MTRVKLETRKTDWTVGGGEQQQSSAPSNQCPVIGLSQRNRGPLWRRKEGLQQTFILKITFSIYGKLKSLYEANLRFKIHFHLHLLYTSYLHTSKYFV